MKKLLIRAGLNAYDIKTPSNLLERDFLGNNVGNLIYAHSIYRTLTTDNQILEADKYEIHRMKPEEINEKYSGYVIPLADAFRPDFEKYLIELTKIIKQLKIPVYIIGVGVRANKNVSRDNLHFPFDNTVKEFIKAVLEKSSIVGLRGEITSQYLTNLGFREGIDHEAIGCPSMYTYGNELSIKNFPYEKDFNLNLSTNYSKGGATNVLEYMNYIHSTYKNASFIPQELPEFKLLYSGKPTGFASTLYPSSLDTVQYSTGNARFFLSAKDWIDFLSKKDFSFGTRLHGNITATIAGTPNITIPIDARMKELTDFHRLPTVPIDEINSETKLEDIVKMVDLHSAEKYQKQNYDHYTNFLKKNGLEFFYQTRENRNQTNYDQLYGEKSFAGEVTPITAISKGEVIHRLEEIHSAIENREKNFITRISNWSKVVENKNEVINNLNKEVKKIDKIKTILRND